MSKPIFSELFKSDTKITNTIKKTLHEINTPISTIQLNTKLLLKYSKDIDEIKRLTRIEKSCNNLFELYNDMEYNIKKEINKIDIETFNIKDIVNNSINNFDDIKQNIIIINNIKYDLLISADKKGFSIVLNNLLSNAIKYNKENGKINIYIKNNILYIKDTGIGIDTKNLFNIYEKYFQENTLNIGFGMGLNIVKSYCDKHNIKLRIDSKKGFFTIVSLNLNKLIIHS